MFSLRSPSQVYVGANAARVMQCVGVDNNKNAERATRRRCAGVTLYMLEIRADAARCKRFCASAKDQVKNSRW